MIGKPLRHLGHYILLLTIMLVGIVLVLLTGKNLSLQTGVVIFLALSYFTWGLFHHALEKELHLEIILEYILFAALGAGTILGVIYYL
ncbi:hypothetical protein HYS10_00795 [Candidatus Collierbacteria bacterium]|nr:hypothetical protein [Candidatus Collierbacteria bacterium]